MHEFGLATDIVRRAVQEAGKHQPSQVEALRIAIGWEQYVDRESLSLGIKAAAQGTLAESAKVQFVEIPGKSIVLESIRLLEG